MEAFTSFAEGRLIPLIINDVIPIHDDTLRTFEQYFGDFFYKLSVILKLDKCLFVGFSISGLDNFVKEFIQVLEALNEIMHVDIELENDLTRVIEPRM